MVSREGKDNSVGIPGRKICRIEARLRGLPLPNRPENEECWRNTSSEQRQEGRECWKDPSRSRDEYEARKEQAEAEPNPCGHTSTQPSQGICPLGEDPWSMGILSDSEDDRRKRGNHECPQMKAIKKKPKEEEACCGHKVDQFLCGECPQIPPPPPPPPPRGCCDRTPDDTPTFQSLCPNNPARAIFPPQICKPREKKMKFWRKMQQQQKKPTICEKECANAEDVDPFTAFRQRFGTEDAPYVVQVDTIPGYRPLRDCDRSKRTISQWVKIACNRPAANAKQRYPYQ